MVARHFDGSCCVEAWVVMVNYGGDVDSVLDGDALPRAVALDAVAHHEGSRYGERSG